jgi:hypothetical protein
MGKTGFFAVAELGVEANYVVTLKWKNTPDEERKQEEAKKPSKMA